MSEDQPEYDIDAWIERCIRGPGGMNDLEGRVGAPWYQPGRISAAQ